MTETKNRSLWSVPYLLILLAMLVYTGTFNMVQPLVSMYSSSLGGSEWLMGLSAGIFTLSALVMRFVTSPLSDRINNKRMLMAGMALFAIAYLGYAVCKDNGMLMLFRVLHGIGLSVITTVNLKMAGDVLPPELLPKGVGIFGVGAVLASTLPPAIGLVLVEKLGFSLLFTLTGILCAVTFVLLFFLADAHPGKWIVSREKLHISLRSAVSAYALPPVIIVSCNQFSFAIVSSFIAVCAQERSVQSIGTFFLIYALVTFALPPVVNKALNKFSFSRAAAAGCTLVGLGMVVLAFAEAPLWPYLVSAALISAGHGCLQPVIQGLCLQLAPVEERGVASGTYYFGLDLVTGVAPIIGGALLPYLNYGGVYLLCLIPAAVGIWYALTHKNAFIPKDPED